MAISLLAIIFLLAVGGTALWGAGQASTASNRQLDLSSIATKALDAQYQENASRSAVWEAIGTTQNAAVQEIAGEYTTTTDNWTADITAVSTSKAPSVIRKQASTILAQMKGVIDLGSKTIEKSMTNTSDAKALGREFDTVFDPVDVSMQSLA